MDVDAPATDQHPSRISGVRAHLSVPLFANAYALIGSTGITTLLGLAYWVMATRLYPLAEVGRGQTAVNALVILSGLGSFRLMTALTRFLPRAGRRAPRILALSYLAASTGSLVVGLLYLVTFRGPNGVSGYLGSGLLAGAAMAASVVIWSIFTLQDGALTGLRAAVWVPVKNGVQGVLKLLLLPLFAAAGFLSTGVFASWMIPTLLMLVPCHLLISRRLLPRRAADVGEPEHMTARSVQRYVAADYTGSLSEMAVVNLIPLIISAQLGLTAVGYFGPTWMICMTLDHVLVHYGSSLTVEGSSRPEQMADLTRGLLLRSAMLVVPLAAATALGAPLLLRLYGPGFAEEVTTLLQLCALALLPRIVIHVVLTHSRVRREVGLVVGIQVAIAVLTFAVAMPLLDRFGLTAPGIGYLVASTLVAVALIPRLHGLLSDGHP